MLDWDDLQVFLNVVEHGTIAGAARTLSVNHSTVLRRVGHLEDTLKARLFDRLPGGYALTSTGHDLAEHLSGVSEQIDSAHRQLMGLDVEIKGVIRFTSTDTLIHGMLMPLMARFRELYPQVQIQVVMDNSLLSLTRREADVAVRGSNKPPPNLVGRQVGVIQTALYASKAYLKTLGRKRTLADYEWVAPDESLSHIDQAKWINQNVDSSRIAVRVDSLVGMVEAVQHGMGVGWLLCPLAKARPDLVRLEPVEPSFDTRIWILAHPDLRKVARIRAFTQFLFDALSQDERLLH
jgi:DNA-binding transcriptional LysR family regulator